MELADNKTSSETLAFHRDNNQFNQSKAADVGTDSLNYNGSSESPKPKSNVLLKNPEELQNHTVLQHKNIKLKVIENNKNTVFFTDHLRT